MTELWNSRISEIAPGSDSGRLALAGSAGGGGGEGLSRAGEVDAGGEPLSRFGSAAVEPW